LAYTCEPKSWRGAEADVYGAKHVLDRDVQAVARGAACCLLHALDRSAKTEACGRSFALLSTQVSTVDLRLRRSRLACDIMLEVSCDGF
jgi:hypothetical protein